MDPSAQETASWPEAARSGGHPGLRSYARFAATFKLPLLAVVLAFAVASGVLAVVPVFVGRFVQVVSHTPVDRSAAYRYAFLLIGCSVGHELLWRTGEMLYLKLLNHRPYEYENLLFRSVVAKPYPYFVGKSTGKIASYLDTLGRELRDLLDNACYNYVENLVKVPVISWVMFSVNPLSGGVFMASVVVMGLVGRWAGRRVAFEERRSAETKSDMDGHVIDVVANFVSVKSFVREEAESAEVRRRRAVVVAAAGRSFFWNIVFWWSLSTVVRFLVWPATILLNLHLFLAGRESVGQLATFLSALVIFSDYIWATIWEISRLNLSVARVEKAYRYLFGEREVLAEPGPEALVEPRTPPIPPGTLQVRNLSFAYPDNAGTPVLAGVELAIAAGEKVGVVGRSGSGKTTLIKLLLGYYPLPAGTIAVDGVPVAPRALAREISYVPQDTTLFHRSIRDNIVYGTSGPVAPARVEAAARRAHAHGFVSTTADGYDTLVGERGVKLSTGQRQRIAIARAFLNDRPILVLDEATSALDSESELLVQQALEDLWRDKTVIAVAHRLSTLLRMDRIVVLDGGRLVEQGPHASLVASGGLYARLWQHQIGGMIAA